MDVHLSRRIAVLHHWDLFRFHNRLSLVLSVLSKVLGVHTLICGISSEQSTLNVHVYAHFHHCCCC